MVENKGVGEDKSLPVDTTPESLVVCRLDSLPSDTEDDNVGLESE